MALLAPVAKDWREQCLFSRPATLDSRPNTHVMLCHAEMVTKINQASRDAFDSENDALLLVAPRFLIRAVMAIRFVVITVVVDFVKNQSRRFLSHVRKERFKFKPFRAHGYSSASPFWVVSIFRIRAALNHVAPRLVGFSLGQSVRSASISAEFSRKATARQNLSISQVIIAGLVFLSAIAFQSEIGVIFPFGDVSASKVSGYDSPSKTKSDKVKFLWHNVANASIVTASGGRPAITGARCDLGGFLL